MQKPRYTADDLDRDASALYGTKLWRTKPAHDIGVADRTIRRYMEAGDIPEWVRLSIIGLRAEAIVSGSIKRS